MKKTIFLLAVLLAIAFAAIPALAMSGNQFGDSPGISATDPATGPAIDTMKHEKQTIHGAAFAGILPVGGGYCSHLKMI